MTATSFRHHLLQLLDGHGDDHVFDAVRAYVAGCDRHLDDDDVADVLCHLFERAQGPGLPDAPEVLQRQVRAMCQRLGSARRRQRARHHGTADTASLPSAAWLDPEQLAIVNDDALLWGVPRGWMARLDALAEAVVRTYRVDHRVTAARTWRLWCWQREGDPDRGIEFLAMEDVVARDGHGLTRHRHPERWRRYRDRLLRRRSRFRERLRDHIETERRRGVLCDDDARYLLDHVLPWLSHHEPEDRG